MAGWIVESVKDDELMMPGLGLTVAHDTLEHFKMDSSIEDELKAFGSIYFIRMETGRLRDNGPLYRSHPDIMAQDMWDVFYDNDYKDVLPRRLGYSEDAQCLVADREDIRRFFLAHTPDDGSDVDDITDFDMYKAAWFDTAFAWIHHGYCLARARWIGRGSLNMGSGSAQHQAADLFWELAQRINQHYSEKEDWMEGESMTVHVNIKRRTFNIVTSRGRSYDAERA